MSALTRSWERLADSTSSFTTAQKIIAGLGTLAVLMAAVMLVRWIATPQYSTLFSNMATEDASAVVEKLEADGTPYELTGDGTTVRVPRDEVYRTRIALSGEGLPASSDGYSLLDEQDLSTSQFQEQTDFKRAMEGELNSTISAMGGVDSAIVHLALPEKEVFSDTQAPPTASVLVSTPPGQNLDAEQVQAIVHLVAASVERLEPEQVTVADATGKLLSSDDPTGGAFASSRDQYTQNVQKQYRDRIQSMLDQVVGPGNSTVEVGADVNFDESTVESRTYAEPEGNPALSERTDSEIYTGAAPDGLDGGVVGPDGQMEPGVGGAADGSTYDKRTTVADNALDMEVERRETAPGGLNRLHVAAVVEQTAAAQNNPREIRQMISAAVGIQPDRGDTLRVSVLPFDTSAQEAAATELEAQEAAGAAQERRDLIRNAAIGLGVLLALLLAWLHSRRRAKQRRAATNYVVEQLRSEPPRREELELPANQALSLDRGPTPEQQSREELIALVENQPEDVASLLRGWLVEK